jgi:hypothetical protein
MRMRKRRTVSPRARSLNALLQQALDDNLILKTEDGREFLLAELDSFDREIELTRQNKDLMRLLDQRRREKGTVSLKEARARLGISKGNSRNSKQGLHQLSATPADTPSENP